MSNLFNKQTKQKLYAIGIAFALFGLVTHTTGRSWDVRDSNHSIAMDVDIQLFFTDTSTSSSGLTTLSDEDYQVSASMEALAKHNPAVSIENFGGVPVGVYDTSIGTKIDGQGNIGILSDNTSSATEGSLTEADTKREGFPSWLQVELVAAEFQSNNTGEVPDTTITAGPSNAIYFCTAGADSAKMLNLTVEYGDSDGNNTLPYPGVAPDATYKSFDLGSAYVPEDGNYWKPLPSSGNAGDITELLIKTSNTKVKSWLVKTSEPIYDHRQTPDSVVNGTNISSRVKSQPSKKRTTKWVGVENFHKTLQELAKEKLASLDEDYEFVSYNLTGFSKFQVEDIGEVQVEETTSSQSMFNLFGLIPQLTPTYTSTYEMNILGGVPTDEIAPMFNFGDIGESVSKGIQSISTTISDSLDDVSTTISAGVRTTAEDVKDAGRNIGDTITNTINDGFEKAKDIANTVKEDTKEAVDTAIDRISDAGSKTLDMLSGAVQTIDDAVTNAGKKLSESIANTKQELGSWATNLVKGVKEKIGNTYHTLAKGVEDAVGSAVSWITGPLKWALIGVGAFIIILVIVVLWMKMQPSAGGVSKRLPGRA